MTFILIFAALTLSVATARHREWSSTTYETTTDEDYFDSISFPSDTTPYETDHDEPFLSVRTYIVNETSRWPDKTIPYEIASSFNETEVEVIKAAMKVIEAAGCTKFKEKSSSDKQFLSIENSDVGCVTTIGFDSKTNTMNLNQSEGCVVNSTVIHELLHAHGAIHEQNRPDRDDFITVNWDNIKEDSLDQFFKARDINATDAVPPKCDAKTTKIADLNNCYSGTVTETFGEPYDFNSIMHYPDTLFSKNKKPTFTINKPPSTEPKPNDALTASDVKKLRLAYKCDP